MLHAVIMAGGSGTRFWPASRKALPKQFLSLYGERTLLQDATDRCVPWIATERVWVVTGAHHAGQAREQLPAVPPQHIVVEPCGRNTAPCIGLAAIRLLAEDPDALMLVTPADHVIRPVETFRDTVDTAVRHLAKNPQAVVLLGIPPTYPATGYGYIERGGRAPGDEGVFEVRSFREKPDRTTAEGFLQTGDFFWNSGIFVWRAARILELIAEFQGELHARLMKLAASIGTADWDAALATEFPAMKPISIDFGVLEHARNLFVVAAPFEWDDVGSWQALARLRGADPDGNVVEGPYAGVETRNSIIRTTPDHLVATLGMEDCIVVHTPDVTFVARRGDEEAVRKLVAEVERLGYGRFL